MSRLPVLVFGAILACILLSFMLFDSVSYQGTVQPLPNAVQRIHNNQSPGSSRSTASSTKFPKLIHYMWKSPKVSPPSETVRWQRGCKAVNPDHEFRMYYDADLVAFVEKEYPQYLPLFLALKGVYMADMARVLVIYHYGGIYMDLDFYCHRPFTCLIESLLPSEIVMDEKDSGSSSSSSSKDVLVVSLEPAVHANIFRDKDRVVIQDFYLATPRHPFFKWFLDDRMRQFQRDPTHPAKGPFSYSIETDIDNYKKSYNQPKNISTTTTTSSSFSPAPLPLNSSSSGSSGSSGSSKSSRRLLLSSSASSSSSLSKRQQQHGRVEGHSHSYSSSSSGSSRHVNGSEVASSTTARAVASAATGIGLIYELPEDVLHSLVDNTNPRLDAVCLGSKSSSSFWGNGKDKDKDKKKSSNDSKAKTSSSSSAGGKGKTSAVSKYDSTVPEWAVASCDKVRRREYFSPSDRTIAVHMWTHTFLGWSFFRGLYNGAIYERVERALPPNMQCPETPRLPLL